MFGTMDLVINSGFFKSSIQEDSIPPVDVCTQPANFEWTVISVGLAYPARAGSSRTRYAFAKGLTGFISLLMTLFVSLERVRTCGRGACRNSTIPAKNAVEPVTFLTFVTFDTFVTLVTSDRLVSSNWTWVSSVAFVT